MFVSCNLCILYTIMENELKIYEKNQPKNSWFIQPKLSRGQRFKVKVKPKLPISLTWKWECEFL